MTFFIVGLICWAYVLFGEVKHGGDMLCMTVLPTIAVVFIWTRLGGKPGKTAKNIIGQIVLAGLFNSFLMIALGVSSIPIGIGLNLFMLFGIVFVRVRKATGRVAGAGNGTATQCR